jgi:hypothetical protein
MLDSDAPTAADFVVVDATPGPESIALSFGLFTKLAAIDPAEAPAITLGVGFSEGCPLICSPVKLPDSVESVGVEGFPGIASAVEANRSVVTFVASDPATGEFAVRELLASEFAFSTFSGGTFPGLVGQATTFPAGFVEGSNEGEAAPPLLPGVPSPLKSLAEIQSLGTLLTVAVALLSSLGEADVAVGLSALLLLALTNVEPGEVEFVTCEFERVGSTAGALSSPLEEATVPDSTPLLVRAVRAPPPVAVSEF